MPGALLLNCWQRGPLLSTSLRLTPVPRTTDPSHPKRRTGVDTRLGEGRRRFVHDVRNSRRHTSFRHRGLRWSRRKTPRGNIDRTRGRTREGTRSQGRNSSRREVKGQTSDHGRHRQLWARGRSTSRRSRPRHFHRTPSSIVWYSIVQYSTAQYSTVREGSHRLNVSISRGLFLTRNPLLPGTDKPSVDV